MVRATKKNDNLRDHPRDPLRDRSLLPLGTPRGRARARNLAPKARARSVGYTVENPHPTLRLGVDHHRPGECPSRSSRRRGRCRFGRRSFWDDDGNINFGKFVLLQFLHESHHFWSRPSNVGFHVVGMHPSVVPSSVRTYLGRGGLKFIANQKRRLPVPQVRGCTSTLARRMRLALHFDASRCNEVVERSTRHFEHLKVRSRWDPLSIGFDNGRIQPFLADVCEKIAVKVATRDFAGINISAVDRQAIRWIKSHPECRVVDSDKNLGLVVANAAWLHRQAFCHLDNGSNYRRLSRQDFVQQQCFVYDRFRDLVETMQALHVIPLQL